MATFVSQFTPIKVEKISALISGKAKKIEAQTKSDFLTKTCSLLHLIYTFYFDNTLSM